MLTNKTKKYFILAGIVGPIGYFALLVTLGLLWSGYNPILQSMSEIGGVESPFKNIMNIFGFSLLGILIALFALGWQKTFPKNLIIKISSLLLLVAGFFMFLVGFFPCDAACIDVTTTGQLHSFTSTIPSIAMPLAAMLSALYLAKAWGKRWGYLSFYLGLLSMASGPIMFIPAAEAYVGLIQRVGIGLSLLWMLLMAIKILRKN
jgi:hypothetical membrane protein